MRTNHVKAALKSGKASIGTWLVLPDPFLAGYLGPVGFDWINVDLEHSPTNHETAALMLSAIAQGGAAPLMRVAANTPESIKRALDNGAWGIIVPMVNNRADAEMAVAAAKYPPRGIRSVGGRCHALTFSTNAQTYYGRADDEILVVLQIEHVSAVDNAKEILSIPGIDAVFIGPNDLSSSMGISPTMQSIDTRVIEAVEHVRVTAGQCGVAAGIHVENSEAANQRLAEGFRFIALSSDLRMLYRAARGALGSVSWQSNLRLNQETTQY